MSDVTLTALHTALRGLADRQRVIATNTANIQTPGFRAGRVSFEDQLASALSSGADADVAPMRQTSLEPTRLDGNNVNLDRETLLGIDTQLRYQLMVRAMDAKFGLIRTAIRG